MPIRDIDLARLTVPRCAIDDRVTIGTEPPAAHFAATERHALKRDLGPLRADAIREIPPSPRRPCDRHDVEQHQQGRRYARLRLDRHHCSRPRQGGRAGGGGGRLGGGGGGDGGGQCRLR
ncbi:MAG: hypothetical protein DMF59_18470 [Acidobacteria bacterium]|nr:MAG: hypothetical protein DMF59_18470 [Acidobacteriota bacterium]